MKNEFNTEHTDLNPFEAPANLWDRVEAELDQQKTKRRGFIWWYVAAGIALVGIGYVGIQFLSNNSSIQQEELMAEAKTPAVQKNSVQTKEQDTTGAENEYSMGYTKPLAYGPETVEEIQSISTPVPMMQTPPAPVGYQVAPAPDPFGSGGGQGRGTGSGFGVDPQANVLTQPKSLTYSFTSPAPTTSITLSANNYTTNGVINGGSVNVPTNGIIDGVHISPSTPTKQIIPYKPVRESDGRYKNFGRLNGIDETSNSSYESIQENHFKRTSDDPLSTFSIDVDGASYSDVRGMISRNTLPNPNAVRLEEFINYFPYEYAEPTDEHPFSINTEFAECPWNTDHQLLKIGIKGKSIEKAQLPRNNLVFLLDVSGSMNRPEKLELLKKGFRLLVNELREEDRVAIAVYAGAAGLVLPPTSGANKDIILDALNKLQAGGSTAGGQGINLAYKTAEEYFDPNGNNRIILATDGDFNVGVSDNNALVKLIEEKRKSGVFLTVLGFGHDNFQSDKMEKIANNGNGNFSFIDNILEAKKVLVTEMGATLQTIAKDVKIQIEFNPEHVGSYRLLGYENRMLQHQDFANDTIDAGELGAGHTVTAVYEIIPPGLENESLPENGNELKYTKVEKQSYGLYASELATVKFRYKEPEGTKSILIEQIVTNTPEMKGSPDFEFIQAVIEFGLLMRQSNHAGNANYDAILERASNAMGDDPFGYRREFIMLVEKAKLLADPQTE